MTDIPSVIPSVPSRLGVTARFEDGKLVLDLEPQEGILHHGMVRASVLSFVIDAVAGIVVDTDPDMWTLTSDMTVRMQPVSSPKRISAVSTVLREGRRSVTCTVELTNEEDVSVATGAIGFVHVDRRESDPPKPVVGPEESTEIFRGDARLARPLPQEAGIEVIDAFEGVAQVEVSAELKNPAGTLQGAMVALLAEVAAEELLRARFGQPMVVTDLDLRYLAQARVGPVRTKCRLLGSGPTAPVEVQLAEVPTDRITTLVYARAVPSSS